MSITVSLVAVFIPVLLMGGIIGRIFNEFAVVVTMAIAASAFVSLTLTPMLCGQDPACPASAASTRTASSQRSSAALTAITRGYDRPLKFSLRHQPLMLLTFFGTLALTAWLLAITPKGFFPQEDIGQLSVSTEARQDISFDAMVKLQQRVADVFRNSPHVANVASIVGSSGQSAGLNTGRMFVELKPRERASEHATRAFGPAPGGGPDPRHQHLRHAGAEPAHRRAREPSRVTSS